MTILRNPSAWPYIQASVQKHLWVSLLEFFLTTVVGHMYTCILARGHYTRLATISSPFPYNHPCKSIYTCWPTTSMILYGQAVQLPYSRVIRRISLITVYSCISAYSFVLLSQTLIVKRISLTSAYRNVGVRFAIHCSSLATRVRYSNNISAPCY